MLEVEEALRACLDAARIEVRAEAVPLAAARGRVLAEEVVAPVPMPPWDNSAMDGYAVRAADTAGAGDGGVVLRVVDTVPAGRAPTRAVGPGEAVRIMTGAPVPEGADAVVKREDTEELGDRVRVLAPARPGQHLRRAGEEVEAGSVLLRPGDALDAFRIGLCAAAGRREVRVARRPRVAILSTGDEVVPPGEPLGPGRIWSSNSAALVALVEEAGGEPVDCGNAPDDLDGTREAFRRALAAEPDLLVSTGGVSMGDFDVVRRALAEEGAEARFWKVRMKPGKPLSLGVIGGVPAFGLPGNPVSTMVSFLQFVRPAIRRALGDPRPFLPVLDAVLAAPIRRRGGRPEFVRAALRWEGGRLVTDPSLPQGSGMITGIAAAQGLVLVDADTRALDAGATVPVQVVAPSFLSSAEPGYRWA